MTGYHREKTVRPLTGRQIQVVHGIAAGYTNKEIAADLQVSTHAVNHHCDAIRAKLGCLRRQIPLMFMRQTGLDPFPRPVRS